MDKGIISIKLEGNELVSETYVKTKGKNDKEVINPSIRLTGTNLDELINLSKEQLGKDESEVYVDYSLMSQIIDANSLKGEVNNLRSKYNAILSFYNEGIISLTDNQLNSINSNLYLLDKLLPPSEPNISSTVE